MSSPVSAAPSARFSNSLFHRPVRLPAATIEFFRQAVITSFRVGVVALLLALSGSGGTARAQDDDSIRALVVRIEQSVLAGDAAAYLALHTDAAARAHSIE